VGLGFPNSNIAKEYKSHLLVQNINTILWTDATHDHNCLLTHCISSCNAVNPYFRLASASTRTCSGNLQWHTPISQLPTL